MLTLVVAIGIVLKEEAELSDERYRGVLASVSEAVFIVDLWTMQILDANDAAHQLTRHSVEKLMTMRMGDVCPDLQSDRKNLHENRNLFNAVFKPYNEFNVLRADGNPVVCEGDTNLIHSADIAGVAYQGAGGGQRPQTGADDAACGKVVVARSTDRRGGA